MNWPPPWQIADDEVWIGAITAGNRSHGGKWPRRHYHRIRHLPWDENTYK
jgi:hypothetical protein